MPIFIMSVDGPNDKEIVDEDERCHDRAFHQKMDQAIGHHRTRRNKLSRSRFDDYECLLASSGILQETKRRSKRRHEDNFEGKNY